jgi:ribonuclease-3
VLLAGQVRGSGRGRTKKAAEQEAAEAAWRALSADAAATADGGPTAG